MGILNVTPDSFADGGTLPTVEEAIAAGLEMVANGAMIIDVGGESTRPGADSVTASVEAGRVLPVVEGLAAKGVVVSIDTSKPEVARAAIDVGAEIVNDVTGLEHEEMVSVCAVSGAGVVIMHMQGTPKTMQVDPHYDDVVSDVRSFLAQRARSGITGGVDCEAIVIDPGIGFGKSLEHNIELMTGLREFTDLGYPLLVGTSRKGFLGKILEPLLGETHPADRDGATAATIALSVAAGAAIVRVHNVRLAAEVAHAAKAMVPRDDEEAIYRT